MNRKALERMAKEVVALTRNADSEEGPDWAMCSTLDIEISKIVDRYIDEINKPYHGGAIAHIEALYEWQRQAIVREQDLFEKLAAVVEANDELERAVALFISEEEDTVDDARLAFNDAISAARKYLAEQK